MAAGDTLVIFFPKENECKQRGNYFVSPFNHQKTSIFSCIVPRNYAGGGITVCLHWAARAVEGTIGWLVAIQSAGNLNTDDFGIDNVVTADDVGEDKGDIVITSVDIVDAGIVAGQLLSLRIQRGDGTCTSAAELIAIEVRETPTPPPPP